MDPQIGLLSQVPADLLNKRRTEENLENILNQQQPWSSATPAHNDELSVDYINLHQPSCSWASQPSSSSAAPEPIETYDRDLPVASVNLKQPPSSTAAPAPIQTCDRDLSVESINLQQSASEVPAE
ncbi:unnamed protein product [Parnassius apollo]|uniref:(apollo) hypothetical protein n=1 Tax=Parnassius apollo TaxID=110799 RepID=A0A8S3Y2M9_PARAO|nr:unnamed protein product [Parnassius apollo]